MFCVTYEKFLGTATGSCMFDNLEEAFEFYRIRNSMGYNCTLTDMEAKL